MPGPDEERLDALNEALARMVQRQQEIEHRLATIESALRIRHEAGPAPVPAPPTAPLPAPPPPPVAPSQPAAAPLESRMGMVWVNRVGVITLVFGVAFFFKYAVDNRWIGPGGRVLLGVLAGLAALAMAEGFWRRDQHTFAQGICGAGIAILYVSFYAAHGFYNLVPNGLAFALMAMNTLAAGALAWRYNSAAIAALGLAGGYLTPIVLASGEDRPWAFLGYVLLLSAGAMVLARVRGWRSLEALSFAAATILYWSWVNEFHESDKIAAVVFALAYYALFATGRVPLIAIANQLAATIALFAASVPDALPGTPFAVLAAAGGLVVAALRNWPAMPLAAFFALWAPYAVAHFTLKEHNAPMAMLVPLTVAFLLFGGWTPWRVLVRKLEARSQDLVLAGLSAVCYFTAAYDLLDKHYHPYLGLYALALALAHLAAARELRPSARATVLFAGIALAFTTLAIPIQFAGYRITMGWALEAAALSWVAVRTGERRLLWGSLAVLALAAIRLLAVDSWMYTNPAAHTALANSRFLTFAVVVVAAGLTARWIAAGPPALAAYLTGHGMFLWALGLEVFAWAERHASAPDISNLQSAAVSILLAAYAVVLVALGITRRSTLNRLLGLGLIAAVVAKLYVYDVWQMSRGMYRVAAFAGLGVFLLIMSYLYSRYRTLIEGWWHSNRSGT